MPFLAAILLGSLLYLVWICHSILRRRWERAGLLIGIAFAAFVLLVTAIMIIAEREKAQHLQGYFDTSVKLGAPVFSYHSPRGLSGDGYSFVIHRLPPAIRARFGTADARLLSEFPKRTKYDQGFTVLPWHGSPAGPDGEAALEVALSTSELRLEPALTTHYTAIRSALSRPGTYYASIHDQSLGHVTCMRFFIIDPEAGLLYLITYSV